MIKHIETPFLHFEIVNDECEVTGTGNTWHYLLLFAFIVKGAKEGQFTNGFANKYEEKQFIRILNKVYECPDAAIEAFSQLGDVNSYDAICEALDKLDNFFEGDYLENGETD